MVHPSSSPRPLSKLTTSTTPTAGHQAQWQPEKIADKPDSSCLEVFVGLNFALGGLPVGILLSFVFPPLGAAICLIGLVWILFMSVTDPFVSGGRDGDDRGYDASNSDMRD